MKTMCFHSTKSFNLSRSAAFIGKHLAADAEGKSRNLICVHSRLFAAPSPSSTDPPPPFHTAFCDGTAKGGEGRRRKAKEDAIHEFGAHRIADGSEVLISQFTPMGCADAADFAVPRSWLAPFAPFWPLLPYPTHRRRLRGLGRPGKNMRRWIHPSARYHFDDFSTTTKLAGSISLYLVSKRALPLRITPGSMSRR